MAKRPTMPASDPKTGALFRTLLPADSRVTVRPMFGHIAAFVNGNMFAGTFGSHVFARLDEQSRAELLALPGAAVFAPMKGRPMKEYVQVPPGMLTEASVARTWMRRAFEWTSALPAKTKAASKGRAGGKTPPARKRART